MYFIFNFIIFCLTNFEINNCYILGIYVSRIETLEIVHFTTDEINQYLYFLN